METDSRESSDTEEGDRDEGSREDQNMGEDVDEQGKRELLYKSSMVTGRCGGISKLGKV
jgi:hypothetical protein